MVEVKWTDQSLTDIENIANYIALNSEKYAKIQVLRIFERVKLLETQPLLGRIVPELNKADIRELVMGNRQRETLETKYP